ncbi:MAG: MFS transporter, partial [Actinomycetota bacterium]
METVSNGVDDALVRRRTRLTWTIFAGVALGTTSLYAAFTAAPLVATDIGASRAWSGVPGAAAVLGTAVGSAWLSGVMARRGRRAGLELGWAIGLVGAVAAAFAASSSAFVALLVAMVLIGIGHSANQLSRFAAADIHPPERRASILGWMVWAGTIGAGLGPSLLNAGKSGANAVGVSGLAGGFLVAVLFYAAALTCAGALRPDPRDAPTEDVTSPRSHVGLREMWRLPHVKLALIIMAGGQVAMILIMTMTPVHIREHGHGLGAVGLVMSSHLIGMFALAPLIGKVVARVGSLKAGIAGMTLLMAAAVGAGFSPPENATLIGASLFLLGLGWCFGFVAGSALLTRGLAYT